MNIRLGNYRYEVFMNRSHIFGFYAQRYYGGKMLKVGYCYMTLTVARWPRIVTGATP